MRLVIATLSLALWTPSLWASACPDGRLAWWKAEGNAEDSAGSNDGTTHNGVTFGAGKVGQAFSFSKLAQQYVSVLDDPSLRPTSFTIEGWFNPASIGDLGLLVSKPLGSGAGNSFAVFIDTIGRVNALVGDSLGSSPVLTASSIFLQAGTWYHIAYTYDGTTGDHTLYIDGAVAAATVPSGKSVEYDGNDLLIGAESESTVISFFYDGLADEVTLFDSVLSATDILDIFNAGTAGKCASACTLTCTGNVMMDAEVGLCGATVNYTAPMETGTCTGVDCNPDSGTFFVVGTTPVTCTSLEGGMCSFNVTVNDVEDPVADCPANITVDNDMGECTAVVNFMATASDNCAGATIDCVPASGSTFDVGTTMVECTATDASSRTDTCTFDVTVNDVEDPVANCPMDITEPENPAGSGFATVTFSASASDNCSGATIDCVPASGSSFAVGMTMVECTATDASSRTDMCTFNVTVTEVDCTLTCPGNVTMDAEAGLCGATVNYTAPMETGMCTGVDCNPDAGTFFVVGTTPVTCTSLEGGMCSFNVTITDNQDPVANCPANITVDNDMGDCTAVVNFSASASDNCSGSTIDCVPASGSAFVVGTTMVECTATDASSRTDTCSFNVTVNDVADPVANCPANITVDNDMGDCTAVVNFSASASDNCSGSTIDCVPASGSAFVVGMTMVECTATDASSRTDTCSFNVTVNDVEDPVANCPANITTTESPSGSGSATVNFSATASDNCSGATIQCVPASGSSFVLGTTPVDCTATDASSRTDMCSFTVTVNAGPAVPTQDLALWLRGDVGVVTNSPEVIQWTDQSGNNRHATQGTVANQPLIRPGALNGLPVVRFDGINDFMTFNLPVNGLGGMTIFLVAAHTPNQVGAQPFQRAALFWNETASWGTVFVSPYQSAVNFRFGTTQVGNQPIYNRPASVSTNFTISTAVKNGETDSLYVNGSLVVSQGGKLTTIAGCQSTGNVGRGHNNDTFYPGDIAEVLVYTNALSTTDRQTVEAYLDSKYALSALSIQSQPANLTVTEPNGATFSVTANGIAPLHYQWRRGMVDISGANSSSYTLTPTSQAMDNGAQFDVVITNMQGSVTSVLATLTVNPPGTLPASGLGLWLKADAGTVTSGSAVTQWNDQSPNNRHASQGLGTSQPLLANGVLNGKPVVRFDGLNDFLTFNLPVNGLTGMTIFLVAANTQNQDGAPLDHHAALFWNETASWGTLYLSPFQSRVNFRFGTTQAGNLPTFSRPASIGNSFTLNTAIKNGGTDSLYVNGALVLSQGGKLPTIAACQSTGNVGRGYNNNTFFIGDVAEVIVYERVLTALEQQTVEQYLDSKYALTAPPAPQPPSIQTQPSNLSVTEPNGATFSVGASGTAPLHYQWRREMVDISGANSSSYTLTPTSQAMDNGAQFDVVITNMQGSVTSVLATLTVNPPGTLPANGLGLWLKADVGTVTSGAAVTQWTDQSGNNRHATQGTAANQPTLVNAALNGQPVVRFDGNNDFLSFNMAVNGLTGMTIFMVAANTQNQLPGPSQAERAALFWNETSSWGSLHLNPFESSVHFRFGTTQPGNQPAYVRPASVGSTFTLSTAIKSGSTDSLYVNGNLVLSQGGKLTTIAACRATGDVGRGYNDNTFFIGDIAEVIVYERALNASEQQVVEQYLNNKYALNGPPPPQPPSIQTQPADLTVIEPNGATFSVTVLGTPPLHYQWRRGLVDISGANNSSYTLTPTSQAMDNGAQFDVVITNMQGSVTSVLATLTVNAPGSLPTADLALWLRADLGMVTSGSAVTQWTDQSGNNRHATQDLGTSQPLLVNGVLNTLPIVRFDGVDNFLTFNLPVNGLGGMTIFMVAANTQNQTPGATQAERAALFWNESASWGTLYVSPFQSRVNFRFGTTQPFNQPAFVRPASVGSAFTLTTTLKNGGTDSLYVNKSLVLSQAGKLPMINGCLPTGNLGRGFNNNTFYAGDIAEVLVYTSALSTTDRQTVEDYLDSKYALTAPPLGGGDQGFYLEAHAVSEDTFRLILNGQPGQGYVVDTSSDLANWSPMLTVDLPSDGSGVWSQILDLNGPIAYFRARLK